MYTTKKIPLRDRPRMENILMMGWVGMGFDDETNDKREEHNNLFWIFQTIR